MKSEPVLFVTFVRALIVLGASFGFELTPQQAAALYGVVELGAALYTRSKVSPTRP